MKFLSALMFWTFWAFLTVRIAEGSLPTRAPSIAPSFIFSTTAPSSFAPTSPAPTSFASLSSNTSSTLDGNSYNSEARLTISAICYFVTVVGSLASIILILCIIDRGVWTDHSRFVFYMTVSQFVYDMLFFTQACESFTCNNLSLVAVAGEVTSFILSCQMQFIVFHLLYYKAVFNCQKYKLILIASVLVPNIIWLSIFLGGLYGGDMAAAKVGLTISVWLRVACIIFNFIAYFWSRRVMYGIIESSNYFKNRKPSVVTDEGISRAMISQRASTSTTTSTITDNRDTVMIAVINRLKFYPLVQACSRVFYTWYQSNPTWAGQLEYYSFDNKLRFSVLVLSLLTTLVAPIGFLFIYFKMQPRAWKQFMNRLMCRDKNYGFKDTNSRNLNNNSNNNNDNNNNRSAAFNSIELHSVDSTASVKRPNSDLISQMEYERFSEMVINDLNDEDLHRMMLLEDRLSITSNPVNRPRPDGTVF